MSISQPLILRLYHQPLLYGLARLVGYSGITLDEIREKVRPLGEQFGKQTVQAASDELLDVDTTVDPPMCRLKPSVRPLCQQLLGPAPENPEYEDFKNNRPWVPWWNRPKEEPKPELKVFPPPQDPKP